MVLYVGPVEEPDKYELVEVRSRGGEGEVWKGLLSVDSVRVPVAVKLILPSNESEIDTWRERWGRQAELLRSLKHPGLVTVREVFVGPGPHLPASADTATSTLCLVMNWVEGPTLAEWTSANPDRHALESMQVIGGLAAAVDYLHAGDATGQPVIHRDIKPANVILAKDGPQLVDFGFVRTEQPGMSMTMVGTPSYISPEAAAGLDYSPASDRYGFGATAYFALTGEAPTPHDVELMKRRLDEVKGLEGRDDLHDHVLAMLNLDPNRRPTSAVGWAQNLAAMSVVSGAIGFSPSSTATAPTVLAEPAPQEPPVKKSRRKYAVIGGVAAVVLVGAIAVASSQGGSEGDSAAPTTQSAESSTQAPPAEEAGSPTTVATTAITSASAPLVPSVIGMADTEAIAALAAVGITNVTTEAVGDSAPEGTVLEVAPPVGTEIEAGDAVVLTVAVPPTIAIPYVVGQSESSAVSALQELGITNVTFERIPSVMPTDSVVGMEPAPRTEIGLDTPVILTLADPLETPDFLAQTIEEATEQAEAFGATVRIEETYSPGVDAGQLFAQTPEPGEQMTETIVLHVGEAPGVLLLEELDRLNSNRSSFGQGDIDGETFIHALVIGRSNSWSTGYAEFNLSKDFDTLRFTGGYNDNSGAEGVIRLEVFVDGTVQYVKDYRLGDGKDEVSVDVSDGLRLRIEATLIQNSSSSEYVILGQMELLGDPDVVSQYYE